MVRLDTSVAISNKLRSQKVLEPWCSVAKREEITELLTTNFFKPIYFCGQIKQIVATEGATQSTSVVSPHEKGGSESIP